MDLLPALTASAIFLGAYVLIATERIPRTAAALGGAGLMLALGITNAHTAFFAEDTGVDWNVIFLLLGMMVIVSVLRVTGIFEYLAIWAAKRAGARPFRLMILLLVITAVASAILDNVTTVLLIAPVTDPDLPATRAAGDPVPDRGGVRGQYRRHRDAGRRPAEHHHRQPREPHVQRLPDPPGTGRRWSRWSC